MSEIKFEVCLQHLDGIVAAIEGGAHRVELCAALIEGGLTPSYAAIEAAAALDIEVMVMIRPRSGDFLYSPRELDIMERDIHHCRQLCVHGVVFGMLDAQGEVARTQVRRMVQAAGPLSVTFHRAFDVCRDPFIAMDALIDAGVGRILTSGQAPTADLGIPLLKELHRRAAGRIGILPGCGITPENVADLIAQTGLSEFHATAFHQVSSEMKYRDPTIYMGLPGLPEYEISVTSAKIVKKFMSAVK